MTADNNETALCDLCQQDLVEIRSLRFPYKLWRIINDPKSESIQWNQDGDGLVIDSWKFKSEFLDNPCHLLFKTTCLTSVLRQLNLYGFRKIRDRIRGSASRSSLSGIDDQTPPEPESNELPREIEFRHPHFRRHHHDGVALIQRRSTMVAVKRNKENVVPATAPASKRKKQTAKAKPAREDSQAFKELMQSPFSEGSVNSDLEEKSDKSREIDKTDEYLGLPEDWNYESYLKNFASYELRGPIPGLHYTPSQPLTDRSCPGVMDTLHHPLPPPAARFNKVRRGRPNLSQQRANRRTGGCCPTQESPAASSQRTFDPNVVPTYLVPAAHRGQAFVVQPWPPTTQYYPVSSYVDHISSCVYQPPQQQSSGLHFYDGPAPAYVATLDVEGAAEEETAATMLDEEQDGGPQDEYFTLLRQLAAFYNAHPVSCPPGVDSPVTAESLMGVTPASIIGPGNIYDGATCTVDGSDIGIFGQ